MFLQASACWDLRRQTFVRARKRAGIRHLQFHDLRHEATARLFELGLNIMEVAATLTQ